MNINVAGAGAGKTTLMAELLIQHRIQEGKFVFCVAFTNAAVENISQKVIQKLGEVPKNIKISTIHSFLYQELIKPYYVFIYGKNYEELSGVALPEDPVQRRIKLRQLENENVLHFASIPEKAKWVAYQKSSDGKREKDIRRKVLSQFSTYCNAIYVDEAQDIDENMRHVIEALDKTGVAVFLYGDPKQDVRGFGQYGELIRQNPDVRYIKDCFRCPQRHLDISNMLAPVEERQHAASSNANGSIKVLYETDDEIQGNCFDSDEYGLKYISMKRGRFHTKKSQDNSVQFDGVYAEVFRAMKEKWIKEKNEIEVRRAAFYVTEQMICGYNNGEDVTQIINEWVNVKAFERLPGEKYARMAGALGLKMEKDDEEGTIVINSIESVKGLEDDRCLFVLTTDLAPYLFRDKTADNKTSHLLYVALTRSRDELTIYVTKEVEDVYGRDRIDNLFGRVV